MTQRFLNGAKIKMGSRKTGFEVSTSKKITTLRYSQEIWGNVLHKAHIEDPPVSWDLNLDTDDWAILRFAETTVIWHDDAYWIITKLTTDVRYTSGWADREHCVFVVLSARTQDKATAC